MVQANYKQDEQIQFQPAAIASEAEPASPFKIQDELEELAEIVTSGSRIPFTELMILDADSVIEQLDLILLNLPSELSTALEIIQQQQEIISQAEAYACLMLKSAEEKASKIIRESAIVRQAELEGAKIRLKIEQECEQLKHSTIAEVSELRQKAIAERLAIQTDADSYADNTLADMEHKLQSMLAIVQNGRQQIAETAPDADN